MNEEEYKKIAKEVMKENLKKEIINNLNSGLIFTYIEHLENENKKQDKAMTEMAIHLGIADTDFKNMELEEIKEHFLKE